MENLLYKMESYPSIEVFTSKHGQKWAGISI